MQSSAVCCAQWSAKALFPLDEPLFPWDQPSRALKGLPTPKRCRWWSRSRWPWQRFSDNESQAPSDLTLSTKPTIMMIMLGRVWKMTRLRKAKNMQIVATKPDSTFPHFVSLVGWCGKVYIGKPLPCGKVCISTPLHTKYHRNWSVVVHFGECRHMLCTYII